MTALCGLLGRKCCLGSGTKYMRRISDISDIQCGYKCFQISTSQVGAPLLAGRTHHTATPAPVKTAGRGLAALRHDCGAASALGRTLLRGVGGWGGRGFCSGPSGINGRRARAASRRLRRTVRMSDDLLWSSSSSSSSSLPVRVTVTSVNSPGLAPPSTLPPTGSRILNLLKKNFF